MRITYKIVMVGDFGVGKTSLVRRFVENSFSEEYLSTIGVTISKKNIENATIMIWDVEGQTEFKPIFKQYLLGSKGFIIVADLTRDATITSIKKHLELCHDIVPNAPVSIALNKADLKDNLLEEEMQKIRTLSPFIVDVLKKSAKNDTMVEDIFTKLNNAICNGIEYAK